MARNKTIINYRTKPQATHTTKKFLKVLITEHVAWSQICQTTQMKFTVSSMRPEQLLFEHPIFWLAKYWWNQAKLQ